MSAFTVANERRLQASLGGTNNMPWPTSHRQWRPTHQPQPRRGRLHHIRFRYSFALSVLLEYPSLHFQDSFILPPPHVTHPPSDGHLFSFFLLHLSVLGRQPSFALPGYSFSLIGLHLASIVVVCCMIPTLTLHVRLDVIGFLSC
jgi:hypothetical protein